MSSAKTVLITGTSSGIGLAAAVAAARSGWRTVATLRDLSRADNLRQAAKEAGVELDIRRLDVTEEASVTETVNGVAADYGRLDAVVNNAGAGHLGTLERDGLTEVRRMMEVNFFGVLRTSKAALPHLRASQGRLLTVTSVGGAVAHPFNEAYCAAKFAVEGYMESLAPVAARLGVTVSLIEPGGVTSDFIGNLGTSPEAVIAAAGPYAPLLEGYVNHVLTEFSTSAQTPAQAAEAILAVLSDDRPPFRTQTSEAAEEFVGTKLRDLDGSAVTGLTAGWLG